MMLAFPVWFVILLTTETNCVDTDYDVIIMGAGMAGISAGKTLYDSGITNFVIIEAQDYIGGRIKSIDFAGYKLNGGASWIHGACLNESNISRCSYNGIPPTEINPLLELADKYGVDYVISDYDSELILDYGGLKYNITISDKTYDNFYKAQDCINKIIPKIKKGEINDISYFTALYLCGYKKPHSSIEKTVEFNEYTFEYTQETKWSSTGGSELDTYMLYGNQDLLVKGYSRIINGLSSEFLNINDIQNENKLKLETPINTIEYNKNSVTVILDNGEQYTAKHGIVTFSLGVLQSGIINFKPKLPKWKTNALMMYDFVDYTAIYVQWPYNFWKSQIINITEFILLNDERFGFFTWIMNLDHPKYLEGSLLWRFDIALDLAMLIEYQSINDTIKEIIDLKLKHYFINDLPNPIDIFVGEWASNPYIQGSYSNWPTYVTRDTIDAMNWNLEKRLFFAGEVMDYDNGYVHSAYFSGIDRANEVLACMGFNMDVTDGIKCRKKYKIPKDKCDKKRDNKHYNGFTNFERSDNDGMIGTYDHSIGFIELMNKNKYLLCVIIGGITLIFNIIAFCIVYRCCGGKYNKW
eukprot:112887_1